MGKAISLGGRSLEGRPFRSSALRDRFRFIVGDTSENARVNRQDMIHFLEGAYTERSHMPGKTVVAGVQAFESWLDASIECEMILDPTKCNIDVSLERQAPLARITHGGEEWRRWSSSNVSLQECLNRKQVFLITKPRGFEGLLRLATNMHFHHGIYFSVETMRDAFATCRAREGPAFDQVLVNVVRSAAEPMPEPMPHVVGLTCVVRSVGMADLLKELRLNVRVPLEVIKLEVIKRDLVDHQGQARLAADFPEELSFSAWAANQQWIMMLRWGSSDKPLPNQQPHLSSLVCGHYRSCRSFVVRSADGVVVDSTGSVSFAGRKDCKLLAGDADNYTVGVFGEGHAQKVMVHWVRDGCADTDLTAEFENHGIKLYQKKNEVEQVCVSESRILLRTKAKIYMVNCVFDHHSKRIAVDPPLTVYGARSSIAALRGSTCFVVDTKGELLSASIMPPGRQGQFQGVPELLLGRTVSAEHKASKFHRVQMGTRKVVDISLGTDHILACDDQGDVWGWGSNSKGQLARLPIKSNTPRLVLSGCRVIRCFASDKVSILKTIDGKLLSSGRLCYGFCGTKQTVGTQHAFEEMNCAIYVKAKAAHWTPAKVFAESHTTVVIFEPQRDAQWEPVEEPEREQQEGTGSETKFVLDGMRYHIEAGKLDQRYLRAELQQLTTLLMEAGALADPEAGSKGTTPKRKHRTADTAARKKQKKALLLDTKRGSERKLTQLEARCVARRK